MNTTVSPLLDKVTGFETLSQVEQVKILSYFYSIVNEKQSFTSTEVRNCFINENLKVPANVSQYFSLLIKGKQPAFIKKGNDYSFHRAIKKELDALYLENQHSYNTSNTLRDLLPRLTSLEQKQFLEEAVTCFEIGCYRASIVMSWLLTMDVIYEYVINSHLSSFNLAIQSHGKYKKIIVAKKEDFNDIKESDFIEILRVGKLITSDIRKILDEKLNFRNTAAHPNTITIKETKAISFIEDLVENIIVKLQ